MPQDIRDFFKSEAQPKELPKEHRKEFLEKLKASKVQPKPRLHYKDWYRVAAILVIGLSVTYGIIKTNTFEDTTENKALVEQIKSIEKEYLTNIDKEWQNFLDLATDKILVERYKKRLNDLDNDYQEISKQFEENTNNIYIIETLVENLQTRLQLLKDIQEHINILNQQKSEQDENTI